MDVTDIPAFPLAWGVNVKGYRPTETLAGAALTGSIGLSHHIGDKLLGYAMLGAEAFSAGRSRSELALGPGLQLGMKVSFNPRWSFVATSEQFAMQLYSDKTWVKETWENHLLYLSWAAHRDLEYFLSGGVSSRDEENISFGFYKYY
jgi:hypothetical protein